MCERAFASFLLSCLRQASSPQRVHNERPAEDDELPISPERKAAGEGGLEKVQASLGEPAAKPSDGKDGKGGGEQEEIARDVSKASTPDPTVVTRSRLLLSRDVVRSPLY